MDAALQINPYYGKTSMAGLREHFKCVWCLDGRCLQVAAEGLRVSAVWSIP